MTDDEAAQHLRNLLEDGDAELLDEEVAAIQYAIMKLTGDAGEFSGEPE